MYTVPLDDVLKMSSVEAHEVLKSQDILVEFEEKMGKAIFVSHQWVGEDHADPNFVQFPVFQEAMKQILFHIPYIPLYWPAEIMEGGKPLKTEVFRSVPLFVWYDYFSVPQLESGLEGRGHATNQAKAIASIHAYVKECSFFFALCPVIQDCASKKVLDASSWRRRGWCRLEQTMRELSDGSWILVHSAVQMEVILRTNAFNGSVGEGDFAVADDKAKLGQVVLVALMERMVQALQESDFVTYRVVRNLHRVYLRSLDVEAELDLIPGFVCDTDDSSAYVASHFFHQNGFSRINEVDRAGFTPLHYAALNGDPQLINALLEHRADLSKSTRKGQKLIGLPAQRSALALCLVCQHNEAAQLLLAAKASVREAGDRLMSAQHAAAISNNVTGIRLLCEYGADPMEKNMFAVPAILTASFEDSLEVFEELVHCTGVAAAEDFSKLLHAAASSSIAAMKVAQRLVELKADINEQYQIPARSLESVFVFAQSLRYRLGAVTPATTHFHHCHRSTPLMIAILHANDHLAWLLITEGARLDLRNARGLSAWDLAQMVGVPSRIKEVLNGDDVYCRVWFYTFDVDIHVKSLGISFTLNKSLASPFSHHFEGFQCVSLTSFHFHFETFCRLTQTCVCHLQSEIC